MRTAGILVAVALSFASRHARAEASKAWTAAKAGLPADAKVVVGLDLAALQKTQLFATIYPQLLEKADASKVIERMKDTCKIDPLAVVQGVVMATSDDKQDGAVYVAISGVDKAKLSSCLSSWVQATAQGAADKDVKASLKQDGNITQVSSGKSTAFIGWVGKDVIVVSIHAEDKPSLLKWMGGKGALAKSELGKRIARVNTSAALWGAGVGNQEVQSGVTVKGGYGAVTFAKGNLDADVHAVMESAPQAATMASSAQGQFDAFKRDAQGPSPELGEILKTVTIVAAGNEVVIKASFAEKELLTTVVPLLGVLGGL